MSFLTSREKKLYLFGHMVYRYSIYVPLSTCNSSMQVMLDSVELHCLHGPQDPAMLAMIASLLEIMARRYFSMQGVTVKMRDGREADEKVGAGRLMRR